jgi:hypothetical protein
MGVKRKGKKYKWWVPRVEGEMEGLQEWRVGVVIWRSMETGGPYRGPVGVGFSQNLQILE